VPPIMKYAITLMLLLPSLALAGMVDKTAELGPDAENRKSVGNFSAEVILVADEHVLIRRWAASSTTVEVNTTTAVHANDAINAFILFRGCMPDKRGNCNVSATFSVRAP
jgi:hypothetical protein